jgi:hypothetical protein
LTHDVFVSRPTATNVHQSKFCDDLEAALRIRGLRIRSLGTTDYSNKAPGVCELLSNCEGVIILGLKQIFVKDCIEKDGTNKKQEGRARRGNIVSLEKEKERRSIHLSVI